jgi:CheY-like chemotaxis protein
VARIAVVDDEEPIRALVSQVLASRGHEVIPFATVTEAEAALRATPPDLLLTDVTLPDGSGLDLIGRLRGTCGREVTSMVMSGLREEGDFARGFAAGAVDYLPKPFSTTELAARVGRCLAQATAHARGEGEVAGPDGLAFGRYRLEKELGRGGYGKVYLAYDTTRGDARVAIKILEPLAGDGEESVLRFVRECYTLASVKDPHVVPVVDFGAAGGRRYLVMGFVDGVSLRTHVWHRGPLSEVETRWLAGGLLRALSALERVGIVHRDLKPENVMLTRRGVR